MGGFSGDQDGLTIARLSGHVSFVLHQHWPHEEAVRSLRALTADRADPLAEWAGILLGANTPRRGDWAEVTAQIRPLVDAGAQVDAIPGWAQIGRRRQGAWAEANWPPAPGLADALGGPVTQVWHEDATEGHREGWWHLVVHPLPRFPYGQDPYPSMARAFGRAAPRESASRTAATSAASTVSCSGCAAATPSSASRRCARASHRSCRPGPPPR